MSEVPLYQDRRGDQLRTLQGFLAHQKPNPIGPYRRPRVFWLSPDSTNLVGKEFQFKDFLAMKFTTQQDLY